MSTAGGDRYKKISDEQYAAERRGEVFPVPLHVPDGVRRGLAETQEWQYNIASKTQAVDLAIAWAPKKIHVALLHHAHLEEVQWGVSAELDAEFVKRFDMAIQYEKPMYLQLRLRKEFLDYVIVRIQVQGEPK